MKGTILNTPIRNYDIKDHRLADFQEPNQSKDNCI